MRRLSSPAALQLIENEVVDCFACPRLVSWREQVAAERRSAFADQEYWGRPVPGFGDPKAEMAIVGLAPAAHGANRTGRVFTGDRSGDWLFAALYRAGFANQPTSVSADDGLHLQNAWVTAAVKCAPPANKPTIEERDRCVDNYLVRELEAMSQLKVIVCLGKFAYDIVAGLYEVRPRPKFTHLTEVATPNGPTILCSFHPSQQNTFTKKLTIPMFDAVFSRANKII